MIGIDLVEGCNFKCYFCRARDVQTHSFINPDLFKRIIDEARELGITTAKLTPEFGEPFLHPNVYELLDYSCSRMKHTHIFTNATSINPERLATINRTGLELNVSFYGDNPAKFVELTCTTERLFNIFNDKLQQMEHLGIKFDIHHRDQDYVFDYPGHPDNNRPVFGDTFKCPFHQNPKIMVNGDITFCTLIRTEIPNTPSIFFDNLNDTSLKNALANPLRYKFFESQSICKARCTSYHRPCLNKHTIVSLRLMNSSKKRYAQNPEPVDLAYSNMETDVIINIL